MQPYPDEIEEQMQWYYQSLSEKDRRRYAAIEAVKLGYGGITYVSKLQVAATTTQFDLGCMS